MKKVYPIINADTGQIFAIYFDHVTANNVCERFIRLYKLDPSKVYYTDAMLSPKKLRLFTNMIQLR